MSTYWDSCGGVNSYITSLSDVNAVFQYANRATWATDLSLWVDGKTGFLINITQIPFNIPYEEAHKEVMEYGGSTDPSISFTTAQGTINGYGIKTGIGNSGYAKLPVDLDYLSFEIPEATSFIDYDPYTSYQIILPFVGLYKFDTNSVVGKVIKVQYNFNWFECNCMVMIYANDRLLVTLNGNFGQQIPLVQSNSDEASRNFALSSISAGLGVMGGLAGSKCFSTTYGGTKTATSSFERQVPMESNTKRGYSTPTIKGSASKIIETKPIYRESETESTYRVFNGLASGVEAISNSVLTGTANFSESGMGMYGSYQPLLIKSKVKVYYPTNFGRFFGYPCKRYYLCSQLKGAGFVKFGNIYADLIETATSKEKSMIEEMLKGGVIL